MYAPVLTLGLPVLCVALQPGRGHLKSNEVKRHAHIPVWQGYGKGVAEMLDRRQPNPEPPITIQASCDEFDAYFYDSQSYIFQLQCTTSYGGATSEVTTTATLAECIDQCAAYNVITPGGCKGVNWRAPLEGSGDCYLFSEVTESNVASETGSLEEAALLIRGPGPDGQIYATPKPAPTPVTETITVIATPTPTQLGYGDELYISVTVDIPRAKRATFYIAFDPTGLAILTNNIYEVAAVFIIDADGNLLNNGRHVGTSSSTGTAALQELDGPPNNPYFWTIEGSSISFGAATFCSTIQGGFYVVYDRPPSDGCFPVEISAISLDAVIDTPAQTTTAPSINPVITTTSNVLPLPTTAQVNPSPSFTPALPTLGPQPTDRPDCPLGVVCPENPTQTSSTMPVQSPNPAMTSASLPTGAVLPQYTNSLILPVTAFEVQPVLNCDEMNRCTAVTTTRTVVRSRTGIRCSPGTCTGPYLAINTLVDAAFADPTCYVRPEITLI